ncbi:alpha/beta fold hydrolase [Rhodopila sp.]|uniref:alpha/beta fold hydrolase n=1 Tax=Rhodopila sp. TaxID=2480087 RepID=UPI003D0F5FFB
MASSRQVEWSWCGKSIVVGLDERGDGPGVLLLPALSSISTRAEMTPLMDRMASVMRVISVDWPGFGAGERPHLRWTPDALSGFLDHLLHAIIPEVSMVVAAGHAATYTLHHAAHHPGRLDRLVLIAPTWRGPLPTMIGGRHRRFAGIRRAIEMPLTGPLLYRANVNPFVVRMMLAGHVYSHRDTLSEHGWFEKQRVINAPGARFGTAAFITGGLDRVTSRAEFLALTQQAGVPILLTYTEQTPPKSRAEMQALGTLSSVQSCVLPNGKLGVHEEFPDDVTRVIAPFLLWPGGKPGHASS